MTEPLDLGQFDQLANRKRLNVREHNRKSALEAYSRARRKQRAKDPLWNAR